MKWDSHIIPALQSETIVCDAIQNPNVLWGKLALKNLNLMLVNQMFTVREMKDKGLHCAPDCFLFFVSTRGYTSFICDACWIQ